MTSVCEGRRADGTTDVDRLMPKAHGDATRP